MKKTTSSCQISHTKELIIETARRLFSKYSYLAVSMSDIAQRLSITKAALYHHFSSKAEIYKTVLHKAFDNLKFSLSQAFEEKTIDKKLCKLIENYLNFGLKEKSLVKALVLELPQENQPIKKHLLQLKEKIIEMIEPLVKEMIKGRKSASNSKSLASLLIGMMNGVLIEHLVSNKKIDFRKMSKQIVAALF